MNLYTSRTLMRTLRSVAGLLAVSGILTASHAQTVPAPVLIPYTTSLVAGNPYLATGGYSGDGSAAAGTTLNAPYAVAVDSVGNIYIADTTNAVIREVNAQTGLIQIIAGIPPSKCTQTLCTANPAYADNVPATSTGIGSGVKGLAVDGYGNVFFADSNQQAVRVIYKGGTQVANLIALEDPSAAPTASAVVPGNIYLIAGKPTAATKGTTSPVADKVLATSATFHNLTQIGLDLAGNIYILDVSNDVARVINAQSTTQTFFGLTLQPGYIGAIVGCSAALTVACSSSYGIGGPANAATFGLALAGLGVDQFGNVYMLDTKGSDPIYGGVAYAGGTALANLLNLESGYTATPGLWYNVLNANPNNTSAPAMSLSVAEPMAVLATAYNNLVLRPSAITIDSKGNLYYLDNHFASLYRIDINSQVATRLNSFSATTGTAAAPAACDATSGYTTTDTYGDGCPSVDARLSGYGGLTTDADGNVYVADSTQFLVRKLSVNNQFPTTAVGSSVTQTLQVHFDAKNLPVTSTPTTTSPLQIETGDADFVINTAPTCTNNTLALDASLDCYVKVTFAPTAPGLRIGNLQATAQNGVVYSFKLSGTATGPALAVDGGGESVVAVTGLGKTSSIAIDNLGNQYIADAANNRVVVLPAGGGAQTTIGTGLSAPQGVAVDSVGNVYIADTGNNRAVEVDPTGTQTTIATGLSSPLSLAADVSGNVYIADTGNDRIVEVPADAEQATSTLRQFNAATSTDGLSNPTAVALDAKGNLYIADPTAKAIFEIQAGGGDLQTLIAPGALKSFAGLTLQAPDGVAVDAAGDVYASDSAANLVAVKPASTGPGSGQYTLSFSGLNGPAGLALDPAGNLYVADSGNNRIVEMNRQTPTVNFGNLGLFEPALTLPLTVANIGNQSLTLASPVTQATGDTTDFSLQDNCSGTQLLAGLTCNLTASFLPNSGGTVQQTLAIQGGAGSGGLTATLQGTGVPPLGAISVAITQAPVAGGSTAAITATVTQPHGTNTPGGTVTFVYTINEGDTTRGGSTATVNVNLVPGAGGASTAVLNLTGLLPARRYAITATYNGDAQDTANTAPVLDFTVPGGETLTVIANPASFTYGSAVPTITGTVTGILPADAASITYSFVTTATSKTPVGTYPITLVLSGGNYLNYVVPPAVTSTGAAALVTENPAPLTITGGTYQTVYGSQNIDLPFTVTGAVNGDNISATSPIESGTLNVGVYPVVPTLSGPISNYTPTITNGSLTVVQAGTSVSITPNNATVLPTNLSSEQIAIAVQAATSGTPTGTVTITDTFTPLNATSANSPVTIGPLNLIKGAATYTPTSSVLGSHSYTVSYSGDSNYVASSNTTAKTVIVDNPDFLLATSSTPLSVLPGVVPGGNQNVSGESAATPETQTITFTPILGYTGTLNITCSSPSSYVTCTLNPASLILNTTTAQSTTISVSVPATLPVNYTSSLQLPNRLGGTLAFLPLGLLTLLPFARARKRKLNLYLSLLLLLVSSAGFLTGCGSTLVKFYTPVPEGEQPLTISATDGNVTRTITMTIDIQ